MAVSFQCMTKSTTIKIIIIKKIKYSKQFRHCTIINEFGKHHKMLIE